MTRKREYLDDSRLIRMFNGEGKAFSSENEAIMAYQTGELSLHALAKIRLEREFEGKIYRRIVSTSIGRVIFNHAIPQDLGYVKRETPDDMFKLEVDKLVVKKDLGNIIGYVDTMNQLDTTGIEPMSHVFAYHNVFREDLVTNGPDRDNILANAPEEKDGGFKVPRTVE